MALDNLERTVSRPIAGHPTSITVDSLRPLIGTGWNLRRTDASSPTVPTPFDPSLSDAVFKAILDNKPQSQASGGDIEDVYRWADIQDLDKVQLDLQWGDSWGASYRHWHTAVFIPSKAPEDLPTRMLVIGVPANAKQVGFLLETYPQARILGIEINPKNQEEAMATLAKTHPIDLERGRIEIRTGDAVQLLPTLEAGSFDFVEADKVAAHCDSSTRKAFHNAVARVLVPGGIFHLADPLGWTWKSRIAAGFEDDQRARDAAAILESGMAAILRAFDQRSVLFGDPEQMVMEVLEYAPGLRLIPSLSPNYLPPLVGPRTRGEYLSRFFIVAPIAALQAARAKKDSPELQERSNQLRELALRMFRALESEGVETALPEYANFALTVPMGNLQEQ